MNAMRLALLFNLADWVTKRAQSGFAEESHRSAWRFRNAGSAPRSARTSI